MENVTAPMHLCVNVDVCLYDNVEVFMCVCEKVCVCVCVLCLFVCVHMWAPAFICVRVNMCVYFWPSPISLPLTRTLALSALSCKSAPELASVQGFNNTPPCSPKYWDTLPLHRNVQNLGLGLKSRGRGRFGKGP